MAPYEDKPMARMKEGFGMNALGATHLYRSWAQVAAYFDGDGSLIIGKNRAPFYFELKLCFSDQSIDQLEMLKRFFTAFNLKTPKICWHSTGARSLWITRSDSVLVSMRAMLPFTYKKYIELQAGVRYYEDSITGNELQTILQEEVDAGRRERRSHQIFDSASFRSEGREILLKRKKALALKALIARRKVTIADRVAIKQERERGISFKALQDSYPHYSMSTLRRVVSGYYENAENKLRAFRIQEIS